MCRKRNILCFTETKAIQYINLIQKLDFIGFQMYIKNWHKSKKWWLLQQAMQLWINVYRRKSIVTPVYIYKSIETYWIRRKAVYTFCQTRADTLVLVFWILNTSCPRSLNWYHLSSHSKDMNIHSNEREDRVTGHYLADEMDMDKFIGQMLCIAQKNKKLNWYWLK